MTGSFLEYQYEKSANPLELGPLAKKIKESRQEKTKKEAIKIVNAISNPYNQYAAMTQQVMNDYMMAQQLGQMNTPYQTQPRVRQAEFEATNEDIAQSLAELSFEDISDIVDRAYQLKSMRTD